MDVVYPRTTISGRHIWSLGTCNIWTPPYSFGSHLYKFIFYDIIVHIFTFIYFLYYNLRSWYIFFAWFGARSMISLRNIIFCPKLSIFYKNLLLRYHISNHINYRRMQSALDTLMRFLGSTSVPQIPYIWLQLFYN